MFLDVKQYANLIQTISFLLKSYKPSRDRTTVSATVNDENNGIPNTLLTNLLFLQLKLALLLNLCACRRCIVALASLFNELET